MSRRLRPAAVVFIIIFAAAQLVRPTRTNPATDVSRTIQAHVGTESGLVAVLDRACGDCHSNNTVWPWYTRLAPLSWLMVRGVEEGRKAANFSEWGRIFTGCAANAAVGVVSGRLQRQDARALHAAASRNAALGPGRGDDLRGGARGRRECGRNTGIATCQPEIVEALWTTWS